jgi:Rrf2 family protein
MLSRMAEHALRATTLLARQDQSRPLSAETIATALDSPRNYLGKTLGLLAKRDIVASSPGRKGGFRLAVPAEELSVAQIMDAVDPPQRRHMCLGAEPGGRPCDAENPCSASALEGGDRPFREPHRRLDDRPPDR